MLIRRIYCFLIALIFITKVVHSQTTQLNVYKVSDNSLLSASNPACWGQATRFEVITQLNDVVIYQDGAGTDIPVTFTPVVISGVTYYKWTHPLNHTYLGGEGAIPIGLKFKRADNTPITAPGTFYLAPLPTANFTTSSTQVCANAEISFKDISTATPTQWFWDFGDGTTSNVQNPKHTYDNSGNYQVKLQVTSQYNCTSDNIAQQTITVNPNPVADFNFPAQICEGDPVVFTNNSTTVAGTTYSWDFSGLGTSTDQNPTFTFNQPGTHTIKLKVNRGGCEVIASKIITIDPRPKIDFNENVRSCINENAKFDGIVNSGSITNWQWDFGDGQAASGQHVTHMYAIPGNYNVTLTATDANSCASTLTKTVTINHPQPSSAFTIINGTSYCSGDMISFKNLSTVPLGKITRLDWFFNYHIIGINMPDVIENDPLPDQIFNFTYPAVTSPTTFVVMLRAYSGQICVDESLQNLTIYPKPELEFGVARFCLNRSSQITTARETTGIKGTMTFSGPGVSPTGFFDPQVAGVGNHNITCTFTSENGCIATKTQTITVSPLPDAQINTLVIPQNEPAKINPIYQGTILRYHWSPEEGLDDPDSPNPTFTLNENRTYTLGLTSDVGCVIAKPVEIKVFKALEIPNVFTPNGDGKNDTWVIKNLALYNKTEIKVFNRWGTVIYQTTDNKAQWDGKNTRSGTYYYTITADNEVYSGYVQVISQ